ncbi:hypothetical protein ACJDU8_22400 [Clostridium sp. WILCCON 0269]|uniref:Uncharacterized protein n=1 Tax=Candidatus Clostridium eludens TaxID=3381663 RepID=A0ABW8ST63_9CLOT
MEYESIGTKSQAHVNDLVKKILENISGPNSLKESGEFIDLNSSMFPLKNKHLSINNILIDILNSNEIDDIEKLAFLSKFFKQVESINFNATSFNYNIIDKKTDPYNQLENNIRADIEKTFLDNINRQVEYISFRDYLSLGDANKEKESSGDKSEDINMDDNRLIEKYIDSANQNMRDMEKRLTEDRHESERRIEEQRKLSEERMEKRYSEILENTKLSEERMEKRFNESMEAIKYQNEKIDKLGDKINSNAKELRNISVTTIWSMIGIVVAIAGLVIVTILTIKQIKP